MTVTPIDTGDKPPHAPHAKYERLMAAAKKVPPARRST